MNASKEEVIAALRLVRHPEGGFFRETYRSGAEPMASKGRTDAAGALVATDRAPPERNAMTSIYYMVPRDAPRQSLVCNASAHMHYWHGGAALRYRLVHPCGRVETAVLGPDVVAGHVPQLLVAGGVYKCAELDPGAEYGLIGESVAPGFDYRDFTFVSAAMVRERLGRGRDARNILTYVKGLEVKDIDGYTDSFYERQAEEE